MEAFLGIRKNDVCRCMQEERHSPMTHWKAERRDRKGTAKGMEAIIPEREAGHAGGSCTWRG